MRLIKPCSLLLTIALFAFSAHARNDYDRKAPEEPAKGTTAAAPAPVPASAVASPAASPAASKAEVEELRREVAELKATLQRLLEAQAHSESPAAAPVAAKEEAPGGAHLMNAAAAPAPLPMTSSPAAESAEDASLDPFLQASGGAQKPATTPVTAGWNGEHFFIKSADGQFQLQPYGYVQTDYRSFDGDGAPANTFAVRRARFGFQGNYGSHFQYAILTDAASSGTGATGAIVRDVYLNWRYNAAFQVQAGQFKEPFAQEVTAGVTNIDFVERGLQSLLYPSAASAFRSPGAVIHGDINGGAFQYWAGAFNGHGYANANNVTSVPETVGRVRFYPWRNHKDSMFREFAFGGSIAYSNAAGIYNEFTPRMTQPDFAYTYFPQFRINGDVWRYNAEFTFLHGPWGIRDEYVKATFSRSGVGTLQFGGLGFGNLPTVKYQAWNSSITYLLTGEKRPENGTPRVKHPLFGPETPGGGGKGWGAFELAFRYSGIQGNEPGIFFNNVLTPELVPTFNQHTDEFTAGVNWYLNYWIRFQTNASVDRLKQPSTIGAVPQNYLVFEQRIQFRF
jgi:phosphate-selective porin OprO/OprP